VKFLISLCSTIDHSITFEGGVITFDSTLCNIILLFDLLRIVIMSSKNKGGRRKNNKKNKRSKGRSNTTVVSASTTPASVSSLSLSSQSGADSKRTESTAVVKAIDNDVNDESSLENSSSSNNKVHDATSSPPSSIVATKTTIYNNRLRRLTTIYNNRLRRLTTVAVAVAFDVSKECHHGSTRAAFLNSEYIREVCLSSHNEKKEEFCQFTFALATEMWFHFMKGKIDNSTERLQWIYDIKYILELGIQLRYLCIPLAKREDVIYGSEYDRKFWKYHRAIQTAIANESPCYRGIINVLVRETKHNCDCMKEHKVEAKMIDKVGFCRCCGINFPKMELRFCSGCRHVIKYCSRKCQKKNWHRHRDYCKDRQVQFEMLSTSVKDDDDDDATDTEIETGIQLLLLDHASFVRRCYSTHALTR
jgi:hypothetical protein